MFKMSDLSIKLYSNEKSYTFSLRNGSLKSSLLNSLEMLPRQNRDGKLLFLFVALNLWIYFPFTNK